AGVYVRWVEHWPDKAEVSGSSPETPTTVHLVTGRRGRSSAGRASPLQGEGQEFESPRLHHFSRPADQTVEQLGSIPETTTIHEYARNGPPDPCPSAALVAGHGPAECWAAGGFWPSGERLVFGRVAPYHL